MTDDRPMCPPIDTGPGAPGGPWRLMGVGETAGMATGIFLTAGPIDEQAVMEWLDIDPLPFAGQARHGAIPGTRAIVLVFEPAEIEPIRSWSTAVFDHFDDDELEHEMPWLVEVIKATIHAKTLGVRDTSGGMQLISVTSDGDGQPLVEMIDDATQGDVDRAAERHQGNQ